MAITEKINQLTDTLQAVDVSTIFTSMALGIAEAQRQLDDNSVKQLLILANPDNGVGGKSLIEMGFTPAFYHFQYADVSAAITLQIGFSEDISASLELEARFSKQGGYSADNYEFLTSSRDEEIRTAYKSSRDFTMKSSESASLSIENNTVRMDQSEGARSKFLDFERDIRNVKDYRVFREHKKENTEFSLNAANEVYIDYSGGFLNFYLPTQQTRDHGVLRIPAYNGTDVIDVDTGLSGGGADGDFILDTDMATTYPTALAANDGDNVIGFTGSQYLSPAGGPPKDLTIYYEFASEDINWKYLDNEDLKPVLDALGKAMKGDPSIILTVTGHADGVDDQDKVNIPLSRVRAEKLIAEVVKRGASPSQFNIVSPGEAGAADNVKDPDQRYATLQLPVDADLLYFEGGPSIGIYKNSALSPTPPSGVTPGGAKWVVHHTGAAVAPSYTLDFNFMQETVTASVTTLAEIKTAIETEFGTSEFAIEEADNTLYVVREASEFRFSVYSADDESIDIKSNSSRNESTDVVEDSYLISDVETSQSRLLREIEDIDTSNAFAIGGSIDASYSRKFSVSMSGNASMSARLVSLPAPPDFLQQIKDYFN